VILGINWQLMYKGFIGDYPVRKLASYPQAIDRASTVLYV